jgi:hypothetical protein
MALDLLCSIMLHRAAECCIMNRDEYAYKIRAEGSAIRGTQRL